MKQSSAMSDERVERVARALEWRVPEEDELGHDEVLLTALGIGGSYDIAETSDGYILWWAADAFTFREGFATVAEAQAAAEADWQRSISAAIQGPPKNCWVTPEAKAALEASGLSETDYGFDAGWNAAIAAARATGAHLVAHLAERKRQPLPQAPEVSHD